LVSDRNFTPHASPTWRATVAKADVQVIAPPPRRPATDQHPTERTFLRRMRNHIETLIGLLKGQQGLEHHGARCWWGLLTRVACVFAAFTLDRYCRHTNVPPFD
jgi:hypothetical protein